MKILGIGIDIIENKRVKSSIKNNKFKSRIYSHKELQLSNRSKNKISFFSKRFAAKEAFSKALGTGFRFDLNFKDIEVFNDKMGIFFFTILQGNLQSTSKRLQKERPWSPK